MFDKKASVFVRGRPFQPSLTFVGKGGADKRDFNLFHLLVDFLLNIRLG